MEWGVGKVSVWASEMMLAWGARVVPGCGHGCCLGPICSEGALAVERNI